MKSRFNLNASRKREYNFEDVRLITAKDFNSKYNLVTPDLKGKKVIVLFYRLGCDFCEDFKPNYAEAALTNKDESILYTRLDTADSENSAFMDKIYDEKSNAPMHMRGVPTVISFNTDGKFYSIYGQGDNEPEYRSVAGVKFYANGIGKSSVTFMR